MQHIVRNLLYTHMIQAVQISRVASRPFQTQLHGKQYIRSLHIVAKLIIHVISQLDQNMRVIFIFHGFCSFHHIITSVHIQKPGIGIVCNRTGVYR